MSTLQARTGPMLDIGEARYSRAAMALHWIVAALILAEIGIGWWMNEAMVDHSPAQDRVQDFHMSLGLLTLLLVLVRIGVRFAHRPPPLSAAMPAWERGLAHAAHFLFYLLMLVMPLTGWALISARHGAIPFFGIHWPAMPGFGSLVGPQRRAVGGTLKAVHNSTLIWIVLANLLLHVVGALKHQFDGHPVLWRMIPFLRPPA